MDRSIRKMRFWQQLTPTSQKSLDRARQMFVGEVDDDYTDVVLRSVKAVEIELKRNLIFPCIAWARKTGQCMQVGELDFGREPEKLTLGSIRNAIRSCAQNLRWGFPVLPLDTFIQNHLIDGGVFLFQQEFLRDLDVMVETRNRAAHQEGNICREEAGKVWQIVIEALGRLVQKC